ncbi:MAG: NUDIX hydrolase [Defluviitaleaceae bacterium]|nr:NUDIX hydrolase [Defluviitaleaceae bacterium]MCL2275739.1 NUDIX hydrolase [Defluviitaleaceae bacterium]
MPEYLKTLRARGGNVPIVVCGASVIVENAPGEILLQLRADNNCWAYPGGIIEFNESTEAATCRELQEETGIKAKTLELFGVFSGEALHYVYPNGDEISNVDVVYICKDYEGELQADGVECLETRFFPPNALPENISPPCKPALEAYAALRGR